MLVTPSYLWYPKKTWLGEGSWIQFKFSAQQPYNSTKDQKFRSRNSAVTNLEILFCSEILNILEFWRKGRQKEINIYEFLALIAASTGRWFQ